MVNVDNGHSFDAVLMYGHELTWIIFEVLLFAVVDLAFYNYFLDGAITYIVMEVSTQRLLAVLSMGTNQFEHLLLISGAHHRHHCQLQIPTL